MPTLTVMPTQVGIQWCHEGAEGTALACILLLSQVGFVVRDDYSYRASIMPIWVPACAGMTGKGLRTVSKWVDMGGPAAKCVYIAAPMTHTSTHHLHFQNLRLSAQSADNDLDSICG